MRATLGAGGARCGGSASLDELGPVCRWAVLIVVELA
jgi:hypothetical protein